MAAAEHGRHPVKRRNSNELKRPKMSELRVILLGSSWSQRNSVGNFILQTHAFSTTHHSSLRISGIVENRKIIVINTPDLKSVEESTEFITVCAKLSAPGPHVFLLVLQPEDFTDKEKDMMCKVLEAFSDQSFNHALILIMKPRQRFAGMKEKFTKPLQLKDLKRKCRYRYLKEKDIDHPELLTRFYQIVKENNGEHVRYKDSEEAAASFVDSEQVDLPAGTHHASGFRIVMLGKSEENKTKLQNLITGEEEFHQQRSPQTKHSVAFNGDWRGKPVTVVKTPDMFSLSEEKIQREMKNCVSLCYPGPNVLLLVVNPSDFSEKNRETLTFIMSLFGQDAFRYSIIILTNSSERSSSVNDLIRLVQGRCYMNSNDSSLLMKQIETIIDQNKATYLTFRDETTTTQIEQLKLLNLVLFGRRGPLKTAAAKVILGHKDLPSASNSSQCVRNQGEAFGRRVSLVELPALDGKAQQEVMEESFRCVSLCDPEGVHAFILVLPVGPLTDEDKGELHTIQDTFSSRVNNNTMILFTTALDPKHPDVVKRIKQDKNIQDLIQRCGGRHFILNITDQKGSSKIFDYLQEINADNTCCYSTETFRHAQTERIVELKAKLQDSEVKEVSGCNEENLSSDCLRIILIGKTGNGKSSSGNTILGRKEFKAESSQTSVTRYIQKAKSEVNGHPVVVVDTPGLFDTSLSPDQVNDELSKCISLVAPGPHVFLLVLQIGRFTKEEKETLELIKKVFGKSSEKFTMILFTRGDDLEHDNTSIEEYIEKKCEESCKKLIADCRKRYHVFNNRVNQNNTQVTELITKIQTMVKENGGSFYTNDMLQEAEAAIKKEMEKILKDKEDEMKELKRKHEDEINQMMEKIQKIDKEKEQREKELKNLQENINRKHQKRKKEKEDREKEDEEKEQEEVMKKKEMEQKIQELERKLQTESTLKEIIQKDLDKSREEMRQQQETWDKERNDLKDKRKQEDEKKEDKIEKLKEEYEQKREISEHRAKEEDRIRKEREEEWKKSEEEYKKRIETLEEKARAQAEESNEFRRKKERDFAALIEDHMDEVKLLQEELQEKQEECERFKDLSEHKETGLKQKMDELQNKHKQEMADLVMGLLTEKKENKEKIRMMEKKQKKEVEKRTQQLSADNRREEKEQIETLKKKQKTEIKDLYETNLPEPKDLKKMERKRLTIKHDQEINELKQKLLDNLQQNLEVQVGNLQKQHKEKLEEFKQKILKENTENENREINKLQKKHEQEMNELKQLIQTQDEGINREELDALQKKHEREINELKGKLLYSQQQESCWIS